MRCLAFLFACLAAPVPAAAVTCTEVTHKDQSFTVCTVDATTQTLRLFHSDTKGQPFGGFDAVELEVGTLAFAMNAGMYHDDRSPVGLYVENGAQTMRLITSDGPGNFGLLPNGVLCLNDTTAQVIESIEYRDTGPICRDATQSGPMLVINGALHPAFLQGSSSRYIRNGVGASADGTTAYFAISNQIVNFHDFATLFRDVLGTPNALFLDGNISRLHAPMIGRSDPGFAMGPIVGVLE